MDTRRTTLIATIIVIALLAVGIGYAYTAYTENSDNTSDVAYLKLTQSGTNAYNFTKGVDPIKFDTYNEIDDETIYYALKNPVPIPTTSGLSHAYSCALLGSITLKADFESTSSITSPASFDINVASSEKFNSDGTWVFFVVDHSDNSKIYAYKNTAEATKTWTDGPVALTLADAGSVTVDILYGFDSTITPAKTVGTEKFYAFDIGGRLLTDASIIFSAKDVGGDVPEPTHTDLNAIALSAKTVTLKAGEGTGDDITVNYIGTYKLPKCTFTAPGVKTFSKWQIGDDLYDAGATVTITQNTTITAIGA